MVSREMKSNGWLVVLAILTLSFSVFVFAQANPALFGHTSEEVKFLFAINSTDCTALSSKECPVNCPAPIGNEEYFVVAGSCQSANGTAWKEIGADTSTSWNCHDDSHVQFSTFIATAYCLKGGTP